MKIRAAIAATLVAALLPVGALVAPAYAEGEATPEPTCEETVQQYRAALDVATGEVSRLRNGVFILTESRDWYREQAIGLRTSFEAKDRSYDRLYLRHVKLLAKMTALRSKVRYLRANR